MTDALSNMRTVAALCAGKRDIQSDGTASPPMGVQDDPPTWAYPQIRWREGEMTLTLRDIDEQSARVTAIRQAEPEWWRSGVLDGRPIREFLRERDVTAVFRFLKPRGWSRVAIATATGLSETRVRQIAHGRQKVISYEVLERIADRLAIDRALLGLGYEAGHTPPQTAESAFLGRESVVVCAPIRREEVKSRPVIAVADNAAARLVGETARSVGLRPVFELIPESGDVDLNRPDLVVICGPRMSKVVAGVLSQDPRFRFVQAEDGLWTLQDEVTGVIYRSGQDQRPARPWDAAYLGRLPRPDDAGTLLLFAGIHPQGSLGVAQLITTRLVDLHREAGDGCFSVLVGTQYDPDAGDPRRVNLLTPLNRWTA